MRAVEFKAKVENNAIALPKNQEHLVEGKEVKVILLIEEKEENDAFQKLAQEEFLNGYAEEDSMYDKL